MTNDMYKMNSYFIFIGLHFSWLLFRALLCNELLLENLHLSKERAKVFIK